MNPVRRVSRPLAGFFLPENSPFSRNATCYSEKNTELIDRRHEVWPSETQEEFQ